MILVLENPDGGYEGMARGLRAAGRDVQVRNDVDLASMPAVREAVKACAPSAVILAAGWEDIEACEQDEARAFAENAERAISVGAAALEFGAVPVLLSSAEVFCQSGGPWSEADEPQALSTYARSRVRGESFLMRVAKNALVVRTGPVLGDGLRAIARRLEGDFSEADDEYVSPVGAVDLGTALAALLDAELKGVVHVANAGAAVSRVDLLQRAARALKMDVGRVTSAPGRTLERDAAWARSASLLTDRLDRVMQAPLRSWASALEEAAESALPVAAPSQVPSASPSVAVEVFTPHPTASAFGTHLEVARGCDHHADILLVDVGKQVGLRRYRSRGRSFHVLEGKVLVEVMAAGGEEQDHILRSGRSVHIAAEVAYRMTAVEEAQLLVVWAGGDDDTEHL